MYMPHQDSQNQRLIYPDDLVFRPGSIFPPGSTFVTASLPMKPVFPANIVPSTSSLQLTGSIKHIEKVVPEKQEPVPPVKQEPVPPVKPVQSSVVKQHPPTGSNHKTIRPNSPPYTGPLTDSNIKYPVSRAA